MPKEKFSFRLSDQAAQTIEEYRARFELKTPTEALERILLRQRYLESVFNLLQTTKQEELACISRIQYQGQHWCVYKPPRMKELETIDICAVCKTRKLGLTEKTIVRSEPVNFVKEPSTHPAPFSSNESGSDRSPSFQKNPRIRGNIYCPDGGFWVWPAKCVICKRDTYTKWNDCTAHEPVQ